jgi:hypothetical protein
MKTIAHATYKGCKDFPAYTLALIPLMPMSSGAQLYIPAVICMYDPKDVIVYSYESLEEAKTVFLMMSNSDPSIIPENFSDYQQELLFHVSNT